MCYGGGTPQKKTGAPAPMFLPLSEDGMREDEVAATPDKSTGAARVEDQVATQKGSGTAPHNSEPAPEPMVSPAQDAPAQASAPPAPPAAPQPVQISCTRGFPDWLLRNNVSLAFTSYQTGRLYLVGVNPQGQTAFHERFLARAMGLWADPQRLVVSTLFQVWRFENVISDPDLRATPTATTCRASPTPPATSTSTTSASWRMGASSSSTRCSPASRR